jgi:hypothetical protein
MHPSINIFLQTRPLLPSERTAAAAGSGGNAGGGSAPPRHCVQCLDRRQLQIGQRLFLFDAVFDTNTGQQQVCTLDDDDNDML